MAKILFTAAIVLSTVAAQAGILTATGAVKTTIENVSVNAGATAATHGQSINLTTLGAGLRIKKVLFVKAKVYVGQLLTDNAAAVNLKSPDLLTQLNNNNTSAFTMTFVRAVTTDQLGPAFRDGFNANNVDMSAAPISAFLAAVTAGGDVAINDVYTFLLTKNADGSETLTFENQKGVATVIEGGADKNLTAEILSLWMGQGADQGVTDLKTAIQQGL